MKMRKMLLLVSMVLALLGSYPAAAQPCMTVEMANVANEPKGWSPLKVMSDQEFSAVEKVKPGLKAGGITQLGIAINMDEDKVAAVFLRNGCIIGSEIGTLEEFRQLMREVFGQANGS